MAAGPSQTVCLAHRAPSLVCNCVVSAVLCSLSWSWMVGGDSVPELGAALGLRIECGGLTPWCPQVQRPGHVVLLADLVGGAEGTY